MAKMFNRLCKALTRHQWIKLSFVAEILRRKNRQKLRCIMRGYSFLKRSNQIGLVRNIKRDLVDSHFPEINRYSSRQLFGSSLPHAELLTRQFLTQHRAGVALNKAILYSLGKKSTSIVYPLPKSWLAVLIKHGLRVDKKKSLLAWAYCITMYWGYGVLFIGYLAAISLWAIIRRTSGTPKRYAYFADLTFNNLPQPGLDGRSHDIFTWYSGWEERANQLDAFCHGVHVTKPTAVNGVNVEYLWRAVPVLQKFMSVITFVVWGLRAIVLSALDALLGRWWHAVVLAEAAKAKVMQLCEPGFLAVDYLFPFSGNVYRPMWTYEAEERGSRILCYFYSTFEQPKLPEGYESQRWELGGASWPICLVWDRYHADLVRREFEKNVIIKVVGGIWFTGSSAELPVFPKKSIAVFDVQVHRKAVHFSFSTVAEHIARYPNRNIQFLQDIYSALSEYGVTMVFKKKREIGNRAIKKDSNFIQKLAQSGAVIPIDPGVSAIRVIERCAGVISMCFTSTALYMRDQDIPSVYYDPTGWIQKDDRGAHGIPILSGMDELRVWLSRIFGEKTAT